MKRSVVLLALVALPGTFELGLDKRLDYDTGTDPAA
jgi:hypothetical protein